MRKKPPTIADAERSGLRVMLLATALTRDLEALQSGDHRLSAAAAAIRRIEATMGMISDETLLRLSHVNRQSENLLAMLIVAHVEQVGLALPLFEDAPSFFQPLLDQIDQILRRARAGMH